MKLVTRSMLYAVILAAFLLTVSMSAVAGKPDRPGKGGKSGTPNENSVATTGACLVDDGTAARVCSTKGISNVVLWCDSTWVKHEDFGPGDVYEATVGCVNGQGDPVGGTISMVAVKSGSQKNAKHHPDGYQTVADAPSGSGLFTTPGMCASAYSCEEADDGPGLFADDGSDDDTPPVDGSDDGTPPDDDSDGGIPPTGDPIDEPPMPLF